MALELEEQEPAELGIGAARSAPPGSSSSVSSSARTRASGSSIGRSAERRSARGTLPLSAAERRHERPRVLARLRDRHHRLGIALGRAPQPLRHLDEEPVGLRPGGRRARGLVRDVRGQLAHLIELRVELPELAADLASASSRARARCLLRATSAPRTSSLTRRSERPALSPRRAPSSPALSATSPSRSNESTTRANAVESSCARAPAARERSPSASTEPRCLATPDAIRCVDSAPSRTTVSARWCASQIAFSSTSPSAPACSLADFAARRISLRRRRFGVSLTIAPEYAAGAQAGDGRTSLRVGDRRVDWDDVGSPLDVPRRGSSRARAS